MNEDLMLRKIIHSRKLVKSFENFNKNFISCPFNYGKDSAFM